jgi:hypothetical protein
VVALCAQSAISYLLRRPGALDNAPRLCFDSYRFIPFSYGTWRLEPSYAAGSFLEAGLVVSRHLNNAMFPRFPYAGDVGSGARPASCVLLALDGRNVTQQLGSRRKNR